MFAGVLWVLETIVPIVLGTMLFGNEGGVWLNPIFIDSMVLRGSVRTAAILVMLGAGKAIFPRSRGLTFGGVLVVMYLALAAWWTCAPGEVLDAPIHPVAPSWVAGIVHEWIFALLGAHTIYYPWFFFPTSQALVLIFGMLYYAAIGILFERLAMRPAIAASRED